LPVPLAGQDTELLPLLGPVPGLFSPIYLLTHPDLRQTPRIRVFFDYIIAELESVRHALVGEAI
jgi:DNA-binding transcriptional LysR family regulator